MIDSTGHNNMDSDTVHPADNEHACGGDAETARRSNHVDILYVSELLTRGCSDTDRKSPFYRDMKKCLYLLLVAKKKKNWEHSSFRAVLSVTVFPCVASFLAASKRVTRSRLLTLVISHTLLEMFVRYVFIDCSLKIQEKPVKSSHFGFSTKPNISNTFNTRIQTFLLK